MMETSTTVRHSNCVCVHPINGQH